jgi:chromosome partitioning protein
MDATIILIANQKGGVGKTTTVLNVAAALAKQGNATLIVDLDPQSSLTMNLGFDDEENNLAAVLGITERGTKAIRQIIQTVTNNLDIAPGDILLSRTELGLVVRAAREFQLQRALEPVHQQYDYILIDAPPSLGLLVVNALIAAHWVLVPTQLDTVALRGLGLFIETLAEVEAEYGRCARLLGVLATMVDLRPVHARDVLTVLQQRDDLRTFVSTIPRSIRFSEAIVDKQALVDYESTHVGALAYTTLAQEIVERVKEKTAIAK